MSIVLILLTALEALIKFYSKFTKKNTHVFDWMNSLVNNQIYCIFITKNLKTRQENIKP